MTKVCLGCKQELPIDLFRAVVVKGVPKPQAKCKPCMAVYQRAYYEANREHLNELVMVWRRKNYATLNEYLRKWKAKNPEKVEQYKEVSKPRARAYAKEKYWENPEAAKLKVKQYKAANSEIVKTKIKEWKKSNKEHLRRYYKKKTEQLSDPYIRSKLATNHKGERTLRSEDIPQELVELKRFQLLIQRELKNEPHQ